MSHPGASTLYRIAALAALNLGLVTMSLGIGWIAVWFFVSSRRIPAGDRDTAADDRLVGTTR